MTLIKVFLHILLDIEKNLKLAFMKRVPRSVFTPANSKLCIFTKEQKNEKKLGEIT